jgi:hypothetical protein
MVERGLLVRMAREGIPLKAMARIFMRSYEEVVTSAEGLLVCGEIAELPKVDWHQEVRIKATHQPYLWDDRVRISALLGCTRQEADLLARLLRAGNLDHEQLARQVPRRAYGSEEKDYRIRSLRVVLCRLRKRLPKNIKIETSFGAGLSMSDESRDRLLALLYPEAGDNAKPVERAQRRGRLRPDLKLVKNDAPLSTKTITSRAPSVLTNSRRTGVYCDADGEGYGFSSRSTAS